MEKLPERYWSTEEQRWIYPDTLPELPDARRVDDIAYDNDFAYTADQMREYGLACARMAREEAARIAEDMPITYERDGVYYETMPEDYAAAIRSSSPSQG